MFRKKVLTENVSQKRKEMADKSKDGKTLNSHSYVADCTKRETRLSPGEEDSPVKMTGVSSYLLGVKICLLVPLIVL